MTCLRAQVKDQQEAERKKQTSQEIQQALAEQNKVIALKKETVREDLAQVEPAVIEAQQGTTLNNLTNSISYGNFPHPYSTFTVHVIL